MHYLEQLRYIEWGTDSYLGTFRIRFVPYPSEFACDIHLNGGMQAASVLLMLHYCMQGKEKDSLFLLTERYMFCVLDYDTESGDTSALYPEHHRSLCGTCTAQRQCLGVSSTHLMAMRSGHLHSG